MLTIYENASIEVFRNTSGEIFVKLKRYPAATIRISNQYDHLRVTCHDGTLTPGAINGLAAFFAHPGRILLQKPVDK